MILSAQRALQSFESHHFAQEISLIFLRLHSPAADRIQFRRPPELI
jgi:hypothetical protein